MSQATYSFVHNIQCTDNNCMGFCRDRLQQPPHVFPKAPSRLHNEKYNYTWEKNHDFANYQRFQMNYVPPDRNVPYLLLPARLSLVWVNKWTIVLILIFIRLFFFMLSFKKDMNVIQNRMEDTYALMQYSANTLVAMPRLMAIGTNKIIARNVENSIQALNEVLLLALVGLENIVLFFIEMVTHTWTCLLELSIKGGINIAADVVEKVTNFVNFALQTIEKDVVSGIQEVNKGLSSILITIEKTLKVLGKNINLPPLTISSVDKFANVSIPENYDDELRKLQHKISLDPVKSIAKETIIFPFSQLRKIINNTLLNYSFNTSLLPVPPENNVSGYYDRRDFEVSLKKLLNSVYNAIHFMLIVIVILAILAIIPFAFKEWWDWKRLQSKAAIVWSIFSINKTFDPTEFILTLTSPWSTLLGVKFSQNFKDRHRKTLTRWFLSYIFYPSSLFVLSLGILGIMSCGLQFVLLMIMKKNLPTSLSEIDATLLIAENFQEVSSKWSNDVNGVLNQTSVDMNNLLFGWVYQSTQYINNTLNVFVHTTESSLKKTFGGTILYQPVLDVLNCMFLVKIKGIEKGLTWIHRNARISFPYVPDNILAFAENSTSHTTFINASKGLNKKFHLLLNTLIDEYEKSIILEAKISFALICAWILIFIMGLFRVTFARRPNIRGMGGGTHAHFPSRNCSRPVYKEEVLYDYLPSRNKQYNTDTEIQTKELPSDSTKAPFVIDDHVLPLSESTLSNQVEQIKLNDDNMKYYGE
ncbi:hypothetical protein PMAC_002629 [Pneumocystis sp. 'macacae']|nr:hypothetical protein PMAC_002629 [Pneumocystis sp. 'macacae']